MVGLLDRIHGPFARRPDRDYLTALLPISNQKVTELDYGEAARKGIIDPAAGLLGDVGRGALTIGAMGSGELPYDPDQLIKSSLDVFGGQALRAAALPYQAGVLASTPLFKTTTGIADKKSLTKDIDIMKGMTNDQLANERQGGLLPHLRVPATPNADLPDPGILKDPKMISAAKQSEGLERLAANNPNPLASVDSWKQFELQMQPREGKYSKNAKLRDSVLAPPRPLINKVNNPQLITDELNKLNPNQIRMADEGLAISDKFGSAYRAGQVPPEVTGELFLWSYLSKMQSAFPQEGAFLDAVGEGIAPFIRAAYDGKFNDKMQKKYLEWAKTVMPEGVPGRTATSNLNDFGNTFLRKMGKVGPDGQTGLAKLHGMISDPNMTGAQIRRNFYSLADSPGIDNKVLSFTLLVSGRQDMMVFDRIQIRNNWDDGRFGGMNIYDGWKDPTGAAATGSGLQKEFSGFRGLGRYEAIEKELARVLPGAYKATGRNVNGNVGRYHWESWVGGSNQEVGHGTLGALINQVRGMPNPIANIPTREGRFHQYQYGSEYMRLPGQKGIYRYNDSTGTPYYFEPKQFKGLLDDVKSDAIRKVPKFGVVPQGFKVSDSDRPFYEMPGVNRDALDRMIRERGRKTP